MTPMTPLITYYGGKQRIAHHILPIVDSIPHVNYLEPFFGGGAVFFRKKPSKQEIINDKSSDLINLYRVARSLPTELERLIELTPYSEAEHRRAKEILEDPGLYADLERAWAYYVAVMQSFSHDLNGGWKTSVRGKFQSHTWANKKSVLGQCLKRLSNVAIACRDAIDCIKRWDSPETLIYIDPPYPGYDQGHYKGYTAQDWASLCFELDQCKSSYILSNYAQNVEPLSAQERIEIPTYTSASQHHREKRVEVLWVCDRTGKRSKQLELFDHVELFDHG